MCCHAGPGQSHRPEGVHWKRPPLELTAASLATAAGQRGKGDWALCGGCAHRAACQLTHDSKMGRLRESICRIRPRSRLTALLSRRCSG